MFRRKKSEKEREGEKEEKFRFQLCGWSLRRVVFQPIHENLHFKAWKSSVTPIFWQCLNRRKGDEKEEKTEKIEFRAMANNSGERGFLFAMRLLLLKKKNMSYGWIFRRKGELCFLSLKFYFHARRKIKETKKKKPKKVRTKKSSINSREGKVKWKWKGKSIRAGALEKSWFSTGSRCLF